MERGKLEEKLVFSFFISLMDVSFTIFEANSPVKSFNYKKNYYHKIHKFLTLFLREMYY